MNVPFGIRFEIFSRIPFLSYYYIKYFFILFAKLIFTEGYILCSSVEYSSPRYNSLTSLLVLPMDDNFSSTTSREVCTLYWNCNSSSGFRHDMYLGEFWKEMQQNFTCNFKIEQKECMYSYLLHGTETRSQNMQLASTVLILYTNIHTNA